MKKILTALLSIILLSVSLAGCSGCGSDVEYTGTYIYGSGFEECHLILKSNGDFTYKKNSGIKDDPENFSGTYTIDDSGEEVLITLYWRNTNSPNPSDMNTSGKISENGKSIKIKIYYERTFTKK